MHKIFLFTLALLTLTVAPVVASDAFLYNQGTNYIAMQNGNILPTTSHTEFTADRFSTRYFTTTDYTNGYSSSSGYIIPNARAWRCIGSGCSKTSYLSYARYDATHPVLAQTGVNYYTQSISTPGMYQW